MNGRTELNEEQMIRERQKLEDIIIKHSTCRFEYGMGKHVEYNLSRIKEATVELLLKGKARINIDAGEIHFLFVNEGNLCSRFA